MGITASMPMQTRIHIQLVLHPRITMPKGVLGLVLIEVMHCCAVRPSNPPHLISSRTDGVDINDTGTDFDALTLRLAPPPFTYVNSQRKLATTAALMASRQPEDAAELQMRIAAPVSVLLLALLAVPLAHLRPRQGRYAKIVFGIAVYLVYTNLLALGQGWIGKQVLPAWLGLWWAHALMLGGALWLIRRRQRVVA